MALQALGERPSVADEQFAALRALQDQHVATAREWLPHGRQGLYLAMAALRPQKKLMQDVLQITGAIAQASEMSSSLQTGQAPTFAIQKFCNAGEVGGFVHEFQMSMMRLLSDSAVWSPCTPDESCVTEIFRLSLRSSATVHELIELKCWGYPCRLFTILDRQDGAQNAADVLRQFHASPCLFDKFSFDHVRSFPTLDALVSEESLQILAAVGMVFSGSIHSTESLHSRNSRRAKHRMTHSLALHHLAMWHQAVAKPRWMMEDALRERHKACSSGNSSVTIL